MSVVRTYEIRAAFRADDQTAQQIKQLIEIVLTAFFVREGDQMEVVPRNPDDPTTDYVGRPHSGGFPRA